MKVIMTEQELIDSTAVFGAREHRIPVNQLSVELFFEEQRGFSARLYQDSSNVTFFLTQQQMIDAVACFLRDYHRFDPSQMEIELFFLEGKGFSVEVKMI